MTNERKRHIDREIDRLAEALAQEFKKGDLVEFAACPGHLFEIVGGDNPFWELEHFGGPKLPPNYHKACFDVGPPETSSVIETVLQHPNPMEVLAIMAGDEG